MVPIQCPLLINFEHRRTIMIKTLVFQGLQYHGPHESIQSQLQNMLDLAKKENAFVYDYVNNYPVIVEPYMNLDDAIKVLHDVQHGKINIGLLDHIPNLTPKDAARRMGIAAKYHDFVICSVNGIIFRILKHMSAEDAFRVLAKIIHYNHTYQIQPKESMQRE